MSSKKKTLGLTIAATAAMVFVTAPITSNLAHAATKNVPCYGVNSCKGKSACKTANNECKGQNSCKGKGVLKITAAKCAKMGGKLQE